MVKMFISHNLLVVLIIAVKWIVVIEDERIGSPTKRQGKAEAFAFGMASPLVRFATLGLLCNNLLILFKNL